MCFEAKHHQRAISTGRDLLSDTQQWSGRLAHNLRFRCEATSWRRRRRWRQSCKREKERVRKREREREKWTQFAAAWQKKVRRRANRALATNPRRHHRTPSLLSLLALVRVPRSRISCPAARGGDGGGVTSSHPSPRASPRRSRPVHPHPLPPRRKGLWSPFLSSSALTLAPYPPEMVSTFATEDEVSR